MKAVSWVAYMAATCFFVSCAHATGRIELSLAHDGRDPAAPNTIAMTLSNGTDHDVFLLGYNSAIAKPDGRMTSAWFDIKDAFGRPVTYKGRYVVSGAPPPSAFTRISPGTSLGGTVDLALEYELPPAGSISVATGVALY